MTRRLGGVGVLLAAGATTITGLLALGGISTGGEPTPAEALTSAVGPSSTTTVVATTTTTTPATTTTTTPATTTTTTTPATTTTTTPATTTTTRTERPAPIPLGVEASQRAVGVGGTVTFSGRCPIFGGAPLGPVVVWIVGNESETVTTDVTAEAWTYVWTAPVDEAEISSFVFRFWCGDPTGYEGDYPTDLLRTVDMVAAAPEVGVDPPVAIIPATG